ncbi:MAG: phenylalanine--tRNA ligase subunit alpha [Thermoplasmata archaeon]
MSGPTSDPEGTALAIAGPERSVLQALQAVGSLAVEEEAIPGLTGLSPDQIRGALQRLKSKRLAAVEELHRSEPSLTARGRAALADRLPERRLLDLLRAAGPAGVPIADLTPAGFSEEERSAAIGRLRRAGYLDGTTPLRLKVDSGALPRQLPEEAVLEAVERAEPVTDPATYRQLERRGLVQTERHTMKRWTATDEGRRLPLENPEHQVGALTSGMLLGGRWRELSFRPYDVRSSPPHRLSPRPHPYAAWLEEFEEILVGLGFQQAEGPLLETEFWNADVLFMPQDHPARSIHDALTVEGAPEIPPPEPLLERVAAAHEGRPLPGLAGPLSRGWSDRYDPSIARRPVLRSQTTAVSGRFLAAGPRPPFRMFSIDRNFRREEVDARHHLEFTQCEGILGEDGVSIRHVVGMFRELGEAIGVRELKLRPSYFPFTEPSIEGYVRHPALGWIEVFPGGLLRPEVLAPLGVEIPVAAWGIGIARLAMVALGINDIRELYDDDYDRLRGGSR